MSNGVPAYSHIVVVVEENENYDDIAGNPDAPYINSLMTGGANLTNFDALTHPSEPNYFALYAGSASSVVILSLLRFRLELKRPRGS